MSFFDCIRDMIDDIDDPAKKERARQWGEYAQKQWKDTSDNYERQGYSRHDAETIAGEDVKAAFKVAQGNARHTLQKRLSNMRDLERGVQSTDELGKHQTRSLEALSHEANGLVRRFNGRLSDFLREHHRNIAGNITKPAQMKNIVKALHGETTGDAAADALANGVRDALEDMRLMFNEAGGIIGKLDNYGIPHSHDRGAITKAGFKTWYEDIEPSLKWTQMEDHMTGKPFQAEGGPPPSDAVKIRLLSEIYDNMRYGATSKEAIYGQAQGSALYKRRAEARQLHFIDAERWMDYNKKYGTGDAFKSLMGHVHKMSRDIASMRRFGPNPGMGVEYQQQLAMKRARDEGLDADTIAGNGKIASRMFKVESGGGVAETMWQDTTARFLSSARHIMTAAFLDRAVISSISDLNTVRLAASQIGMNPQNVLSRHVKMMADNMTQQEAARAGWVADTLADPGAALARFQSEVPPSEVAERLSSASMRIQGLAAWTDAGRIAFQMEMSGLMAAQADRALSAVDKPLQDALRKSGLTDDDWAKFTNPDHIFTAGNGATFASPFYWREATDIPFREAEDIFTKIQSVIEEQTEFAVPTQNLLARGYVDPAAYDMPPGTLGYEIMKSTLMFKSFTMTFTVNQWRRTMAQQGEWGRSIYAANLIGWATVLGAVALQIGEIAKGNDPQPMANVDFMARAALKGGGFAILGDIISTGQTTWGGGFSSYVAGPVPQAIGDVWDLSVKNAYQAATGQDTNIAKEATTALKRYTPMAQTPAIGPAFDRLVADQLFKFLDPEAEADFSKRATAQKNRAGNASWWMPGSPVPERAPDLSGLLGG
tara:strand:+ start:37392 stop:39872 length:2481 start_codon:yes stop_codon:yes gene_type:complete